MVKGTPVAAATLLQSSICLKMWTAGNLGSIGAVSLSWLAIISPGLSSVYSKYPF